MHVLGCKRGETIGASALAVSSTLSESCQNQTTEYLSKQRQAHSSRCRSLCCFGVSNGCSNLSELMRLSKQHTMQKGVCCIWKKHHGLQSSPTPSARLMLLEPELDSCEKMRHVANCKAACLASVRPPDACSCESGRVLPSRSDPHTRRKEQLTLKKGMHLLQQSSFAPGTIKQETSKSVRICRQKHVGGSDVPVQSSSSMQEAACPCYALGGTFAENNKYDM